MIVFKKMGLLGPFLYTAAAMRFSVEPKRQQLSLSAQKAVWATSIIKTIANAAPPSTIKDPTLRDVIFNLPDPSTQFYFEKSEREKVMDLFKEGIYLAPTFLAQSKVAQAQQKEKQNQSLKKFIFFPNRSVTSPMFQKLLNYSAEAPDSILLTGGFGISKTVSIILFIHLSYHQTLYAYEALKDEKKMKEYNRLIQMKLIPKNASKYWYWSAHYQQDGPIIKLLVDQAIQIEQNIKDQLYKETSLSQLITKLDRLYPTWHVTSRPIIDQFHFIASALRKQNKLHQTHNPTSIISRNSVAFKYLSLLNKLVLLGSRFTLISSMTIETDLLQKDSYYKLAFGYSNSHDPFHTTHIPYEKTITTKEGQIDFWQTFWLEMERRMKLYSKTQAEIAAAKETFYKYASHVQLSKLAGFSKFIYVRTFLDASYASLLKALSQQSDQLIQEQLQNFKYHCVKDEFKKMKQYLRKGNTREKAIILNKILIQAYLLHDNEFLWNAQFRLTKEQMEDIIFGSLQNEGNVSKKQGREVRNLSEIQAFTDLKPFLITWEDDIQFNFTAAQLEMLIFPLFFNDANTDITDQPDVLLKAFIQSKGTGAGLIQSYLIKLLSKGGISFKASQITGKEQVQKLFTIFKQVAFEPINDLSKQISSLKNKETQNPQKKSSNILNFRYAIDLAMQNPDEDILALPYVVNGHKMRYANNSASIDFLILRYNEELNKLYISTFDPTLTEISKEKINNARTLLRKFIATQNPYKEIDIEINHTILITDDASIPYDKTFQEKNVGIMESKVNIYLAQLKFLNFYSEDTISLESFHYFQTLNERVSEQSKNSMKVELNEKRIQADPKMENLMLKNKLKQLQMKLQALDKVSKSTE